MHTTIITYDNRQVSVPNGVLVNTKISNLTNEGARRIDITVPVPYGCDIALARKILLDTVKKNDKTFSDGDHKQFARVYDYADSAIIIATCGWCKPDDYWKTYFELREQYLAALGEQGIYVPFNQLDVSVKTNKD